MTETPNTTRPTSPHLQVWKWGPGMTVSIVHRVMGSGLAIIGSILLVWWLLSLSSGAAMYGAFLDVFTYNSGKLNLLGWIFGIGLTFALFQHLASGVRHFFMDVGDNFELGANKATAWLTLVVALVLTLGFWLAILEKING